jgi:6-phosphogluconolactonase
MKPTVRIFKDLEALSQVATETFIRSAAEAIEKQGRFLVALSGGSTPDKTYKSLASPAFRSQVDWSRVFVFWADERCVPPEQPGSNFAGARQALLGHVPIPEENLLRIRGELPPQKAAANYARTLEGFAASPLNWPRFDLVMLGLGADGHTASLFPGSPLETTTPTMVVNADYQDRPANRVTLTPQVFNTARLVVFLVSGEGKAHALASVLEGEKRPLEFPAQRIQPENGQIVWLVDQAASRLFAR